MSKIELTKCDVEGCGNTTTSEPDLAHLENPGWLLVLFLGERFNVCPDHAPEVLKIVGMEE